MSEVPFKIRASVARRFTDSEAHGVWIVKEPATHVSVIEVKHLLELIENTDCPVEVCVKAESISILLE